MAIARAVPDDAAAGTVEVGPVEAASAVREPGRRPRLGGRRRRLSLPVLTTDGHERRREGAAPVRYTDPSRSWDLRRPTRP
jgi:hypothetical protein